MKELKIYMLFILLSASLSCVAQQNDTDEKKTGFKKENIFLGSGLNLGFANYSFTIGINPEIGYSVTKWLDAGIALNFNYYSQNTSEMGGNTKFSNFNYGGGTFVRIWPVNFLFIQALPEYNWINSSQTNIYTNTTTKFKANAGSLLLGIGYGSRVLGNRYSYFSLMIDVLQNPDSPYRDPYANDPFPVFRAGIGFYLK